MTKIAIPCPDCDSLDIVKYGKAPTGKQKYLCQNPGCSRKTFILDYTYNAHKKGVKDRIIDMTMNASGVRDIARVLQISPTTVIDALKKRKINLFL